MSERGVVCSVVWWECGVVWYSGGVVWCSVMWCSGGVVWWWCGVVLCGVVLCSVVLCGGGVVLVVVTHGVHLLFLLSPGVQLYATSRTQLNTKKKRCSEMLAETRIEINGVWKTSRCFNTIV